MREQGKMGIPLSPCGPGQLPAQLSTPVQSLGSHSSSPGS